MLLQGHNSKLQGGLNTSRKGKMGIRSEKHFGKGSSINVCQCPKCVSDNGGHNGNDNHIKLFVKNWKPW